MKADVFSFGLVLYEFLTLSYPHRTEADSVDGVIPPIPVELADEHPRLVSLIKRCCRYNPDKRPPMFSVVRELEDIRDKYDPRTFRKPTIIGNAATMPIGGGLGIGGGGVGGILAAAAAGNKPLR